MAGGRDYIGARYTGPRSKGQSAVRLARYMEERENEDGGREWATTFGDREEFIEQARERAVEGRRSSYVHLVVSPERGEELNDGDFGRIAEEVARGREGEEAPYYAAVHRDTDNPHLHIAIARDKYVGSELEDLKEGARELMESRERLRDEPWRERVEEREAEAVESEVQRSSRETAREQGGLDHGTRGSTEAQQEIER